MLAHWLLEELSLPASNSTRILVAECIRLLAKGANDSKEAADMILKRAQFAVLAGELVNRFWFEDRKYLTQSGPHQAGYIPQPVMSEQDIYEDWLLMSESFKKSHPWKREVR